MEFIIKELQIIVADNNLTQDNISYTIRRSAEKVSAKTIRKAFEHKHSTKFDLGGEIICYCSDYLFNERGNVIGVLGHINSKISEKISINQYKTISQWFISSEISPKFIKWMEKYCRTAINILSPSMFKDLCNCPVDIMQDKQLTRKATEEYLKRNFSNINGLELLNNEEPPTGNSEESSVNTIGVTDDGNNYIEDELTAHIDGIFEDIEEEELD